jgi:hypothetical protein
MAATSKQAKQSAIVSRAQLARARGPVERATAWIVLVVSFIGTIVVFYGGWSPILELHFSISAILAGFGVQALLTWLQWVYHHNRPLCWGSRIIDASLTAYGYGPLFVVALASYLTLRGVPWPDLVAWVLIGLVSLGLAWYPESRLVD